MGGVASRGHRPIAGCILVAALGDLGAGVVVEVAAVAVVVPDGAAAAEGEAAGLGVVFVGVDAAALAGLKVEAGEAEVLAGVAGVETPAAEVDDAGTGVGDDDVFVGFDAGDGAVVVDPGDLDVG